MPFLWYNLFLTAPIFLVFCISWLKRGTYGNIENVVSAVNYQQLFDPLYLSIVGQTILIASTTTCVCLLIGIPCAWVISRTFGKLKIALTLAISLPSLTNLLIRIYAIQILLRPENEIGKWLGFQNLSSTWWIVQWGMVTTYLPFMIIPLSVAFDRFDQAIIEAARDLGAGELRVLLQIVIPNVKAAIVSGCTMVFIPSLGEYLIPDLLGGAQTVLVGNLVAEQFLKSRNWPLGSALAMILTFALISTNLLSFWWSDRKRERRAETVMQ
jgi:spermidine/putrescine transport system permease protein